MTASIPPISDLLHIFFDERACDDYLLSKGVYWTEMSCPQCGRLMTIQKKTMRFRCSKNGCRKSISLKANSLFSGHKLPSSTIMMLAYFWLNELGAKSMIAMTKCGSATVTSFCNSFRQLVSESLDIESVTVIGGEGIEVEIDESKLGKRKHNRGHRVEWVIGGVERTPERKVFLVQVENRTAETIGDIISKHVKPGSIIYMEGLQLHSD
jgi:hypothetical protein